MAVKINWEEHRTQFEKLKEEEGLTCSAYAKRFGLNERSARRNLLNEPKGKPKAKPPALSPKEANLKSLLAATDTDNVGDAELLLMRDTLNDYVKSQRDNIEYLRRECDSFDGKIPFDDERYIEPSYDKDDKPISPHKALAAACLELLGVVTNTGKAIGSLRGSIARARSLKIAALSADIAREQKDKADQAREKAVIKGLAGFQSKEDAWTARKAAAYIEAAGATVPHVIRAQLAIDLAADAGDEGEPISEEALDAMCDAAAMRQETWLQEVAERRAAVQAMVERELEDNADNDSEIILAADPTDVDDASFDDDCVVIGGGQNGD